MSFVQDAADSLLYHSKEKSPTTYHQSMKAVVWESDDKVSMVDRPKPEVLEPGDAIIRITSASLCGSDLHFFHHDFSGIKKGDVLGHEAMGIIDSVGSGVNSFKVGDRVVISPVLSDGTCKYCKAGWPDSCEATNTNEQSKSEYGRKHVGLLGDCHMTGGGHDGVFAEYTRIPYADYNLLKIPNYLPDEKVLFLSESLTSAWHACENAEINKDTKTVALYGCGSVGLSIIMWIKKVRAPECQVVAIDSVPERLNKAWQLGASHMINYQKENVLERLNQLVPEGPDACIDAVGFLKSSHGFLSRVEHALGIDTPSCPQVISQCIRVVKKRGIVSIIGDYSGDCDGFPIGDLFEKGITLRAGIVPVQRYWKQLLEYIDQGMIDPTQLVTHYFALDKVEEAFQMFDKRGQGAIKILIQPDMPFSTS